MTPADPEPTDAGAAALRRTRIKICGLTREADVDAAAAAGADAIGFVLYPKSPRHVSAERAGHLARWLPAFITPVLLFVNATPDEVRAAQSHVPGALVQYHGDESPAQCEAAGLPHLRAARIPTDPSEPFDLLQFALAHSAAQGILLDTLADGFGGSGRRFDWNRIPWSQLPTSVSARLVLSGGLTPANVGDGMAIVRPWAVDVSSGVESAKGIKDAGLIRQFVAAVRRADEQIARSSHVRLPAA